MNQSKQIYMENRIIPFGNFDNVKVGDEVVLHTWKTTNNGTEHHFCRDKVIAVGEKNFMVDMVDYSFAKLDGNLFRLDWINCNVFPMEIVEKYGIVLEN